MSFSLDTPSIQTLKSEARALRESRAKGGASMTHSAALEAVARTHGYRDWNTARATLPDRAVVPFQVGMRVKGAYLGQSFRGVLIGVQMLSDMQHHQVTVRFDDPVDVARSELFSTFRQRVVATVDVYGASMARTGDGQPQMRLARE